MGCGRTDAQVHASQFFFHTDIKEEWNYDLVFRLNKVLPDDIAIFEIIPVEEKHHARFDAVQRTYDYFIHTYKDPFLSNTSSLYLEKNLDLASMKAAVSLLTIYNDFRAFCKAPNDHNTTLCAITSATLFADNSGDRLRFQVSADRFLGMMIRIIMGRLLKIGRREMSVDEFEQMLISKESPGRLEAAYPQGLYLSKVTYPYLDLPLRAEFSIILQNKESNWVTI